MQSLTARPQRRPPFPFARILYYLVCSVLAVVFLFPLVNSIGGFSIFLAGEAAGFRPSTQGGKRRLHA